MSRARIKLHTTYVGDGGTVDVTARDDGTYEVHREDGHPKILKDSAIADRLARQLATFGGGWEA
jgi:hypothetical protein